MIKIDRLWLVRPNLGNPLILEPDELQNFTITLAYSKPWRAKESTIEWPSSAQLHTLELSLTRGAGAMRLVWKNIGIPLKVHKIHDYKKHPYFEDDYEHVKHAITSSQQQYRNGFRWEVKVDVGISTQHIERLRDTVGWPALLHIENRFTNRPKRNWHAIYVHPTMKRSEKLTILHITDTHIAKRYDSIPGILCSVRNEAECTLLEERYHNFNDHLRAFIKEANERVKRGENVIVVLTGDITDYFFDGYWNGRWACGQGEQWKDRREELAGSSWNSNVRWFTKIITGQDGRSEPLKCPIFTIIGNHEYYANEILLDFKVGTKALRKFHRIEQYRKDLNLGPSEEREYDYWAFPNTGRRPLAERKTFKESGTARRWQANLADFAGDESFWLIKPKSWILSQYLCEVNYDLDFEVKIGKRHLLFFNTGNDLFPSGFDAKLEMVSPSFKRNYDYVNGGPHCRGITQTHLAQLRGALREHGEKLVFIFTHAPLVQIQGAPEEKEDPDITYWYEQNLDYENQDGLIKAGGVLIRHYHDVWEYCSVMDRRSFLNRDLCPKGCFKSGHRYMVDYFCAEGWNNNLQDDSLLERFLDNICRDDQYSETGKPIIVLSGHTHKVHEFRIVNPRETAREFGFYFDDYSSRYFPMIKTENEKLYTLALLARYGLLKSQSPFLVTSGSLRKSPQYREIMISGLSIASLEMKQIDMKKYSFSPKHSSRLHKVSPVSFEPGCELITLRAHNGQYVCAESGGDKELFANRSHPAEWEILELMHLEGNRVALKAVCNGKFIRAEGGGGGRLRPDRHWIKEHETFILESKGDNKIALRTHNGKYVCAESGGGRELIANRDWAREWETFEANKAPLYAPSLIAPKNGKKYEREPSTVTLRWTGVAGAVRYEIEVEGKSRSGSSWSQILSRKIKRTQYRLNVTRSRYLHFRWRVWAVGVENIDGPKSGWSCFKFLPTL